MGGCRDVRAFSFLWRGFFWDLCLSSLESSPKVWASGADVFCCGSFPNSWVWTWRSWKKSKKMLGWETEAWAAWQVIWGEGGPLLAQSARGLRVSWLEAVTASPPAPQWDSVWTAALQQCGALLPAPGWPETSPLPSESIQVMELCSLQHSRWGCG